MKIPGNLGAIMQQAQTMQAKMKEIQENLKSKEIEASAGGDMVIVKMNGDYEITSLKIKPEVLQDDIEMLEDLVTEAVNEAVRNVKEMTSEAMSEVTGGLNIPGMGNLF